MTNFSDKPELLKGMKVISSIILLFLMILFLCVMSGCRSTRYVPVETIHTEYVEADTTAIYSHIQKLFEARKEKELHSDSLIDNTQEKIVLNEHGDTVRIYSTRYIYKSNFSKDEWERINAWGDSVAEAVRARLRSERADSVPQVIIAPEESKKDGQSVWLTALKIILGCWVFGIVLVVAAKISKRFKK